MKIRLFLLCAAVLFGSGCIYAPAPRAVTSISIEVDSSPDLIVDKPHFRWVAGHLELAGTARSVPGFDLSPNIHLDIQFRDQAGTVVLEHTTWLAFRPSVFHRDRFIYSNDVVSVPPGTVQIRISVDDRPFHVPQTSAVRRQRSVALLVRAAMRLMSSRVSRDEPRGAIQRTNQGKHGFRGSDPDKHSVVWLGS